MLSFVKYLPDAAAPALPRFALPRSPVLRAVLALAWRHQTMLHSVPSKEALHGKKANVHLPS
jgi:hypothetical protein